MLNVGVVSYSAGAILFAILAIALAVRWRGRLGGKLLFFTTLVNAVWASAFAWFAVADHAASIRLVAATDVVRGIVWLLLIWHLAVVSHQHGAPRALRYLYHGTWIAAIVVTIVSHLYVYATGEYQVARLAMIASGFLLAVAVLVLIEQFYRNSSQDYRWEIKFFCLGVGGLFAYDIFLFANGLLFLRLDSELWQARGAVNALAVPLIAMSVRRASELPTEQAFSRRIVFYSTGLLGVGLYLLVMAAGGYVVRMYGGTWGGFAQILFLCGALFLLAAVLFSGQARARVKVFLDKHFFDYRYDYRVEWLNLTRRLSDTESEQALGQRAIVAVAEPVDSHAGILLMHRDNRFVAADQWNISDAGFIEEPEDSEFCRFLREREWIVDIEEHGEKPEIYSNLALPPWLDRVRDAWLVVPLIESEKLLGFVVLARSRAMRALTWEDHDLLKTVGRQVAGHLALNESAQLLAETRQFQAYNKLTAFLMHDIKNLIAQQSLVVRNAAKHKDNPEFIDDAIATVDNSVRRMQRLLEQLRQGGAPSAAQYAGLGAICRDVVAQNSQRKPRPSVEFETEGLRVTADPEGLGMVLGHLVRNAQEATPPEGSVTLIVRREGDQAIIDIRDTGTGMNEDFMRHRLFKPFDTTKGVKGMGIGVYQAREFMRSSGGALDVESTPGAGSIFRARLPLAPNVDQR